MTTSQAFKQLIETKGIYKILGVAKNTVSSWKKRKVSTAKMEAMLTKGGYTVIREKQWKRVKK